MNTDKKIYLEVIRILAVLFVIFNHTDGFIYYTTPCSAPTYLYSLILAVLCRMAVPLFFMVSGALLLPGEESVGRLLRRRVARMLLVLNAVSLLYYVFDIARGRIARPGAGDFFSRLLSGGIRDSFWFLYVYIGVLLVLPFFRKLAPYLDRKSVLYLMALKGLCSLAVPVVEIILERKVYFEFGFVDSYIYYLLMGYYIEKEGLPVLSPKREPKPLRLMLNVTVLVALNGVFLYYGKKVSGDYQAVLLDVFAFLTAPLTFAAVKDKMMAVTCGEGMRKIILTLGSCVFGIYLFDNFVRWQLLPLYLFLSEKTAGLIANSVYVLLTFAGGFAYTWILKRIPPVRRYL